MHRFRNMSCTIYIHYRYAMYYVYVVHIFCSYVMILQVWAVFDLYGMCEEVAIAGSEGHNALIAAGTEGHSALLLENFELKEHVSRVSWKTNWE